MTPTPHQPLTPELIAAADRMHAQGRNMFDAVVRDYTHHRDTCTDPVCETRQEETATAGLAVEIYDGIFQCGHMECLKRNVQTLCTALAYAGVRTAEGRPLVQQQEERR